MMYIIAICGFPGSGKTKVARELVMYHDAVHLSSDGVRKELACVAPETNLPNSYYSKAHSRAVGDAIINRVLDAAYANKNVVFDRVMISEPFMARLKAITKVYPYFLEVPADEAYSRIMVRPKGESDITEGNMLEVVGRMRADLHNPPRGFTIIHNHLLHHTVAQINSDLHVKRFFANHTAG